MDFSMKLNDNKAGLEGLDKDRINAIIKEASKNSLYTKHQEKRAKRIEERIQQQQEVIAKLSSEQIRVSEMEMDRLAKQMEESRDLSRTVVHIDMDAFYAAVEMRDNPALRDKPMAVGGMSMLSTSNYIARRFGVRAAMAGYIGKKLCPQLIIVPCNFGKYTAVSEQIRLIMAEYDPNFYAIGLDEASLDITDHMLGRMPNSVDDGCSKKVYQRRRYTGDCICKLPRYEGTVQKADCLVENCEKCGKERLVVEDDVGFGHSPEEVTNELRFRIEQKTGLTASAGIAVNKRLAKVCADIRKPNGQYYLPPDYDSIMEFVRKLPIRKISGIGGVTESMLKAIGVETCKDLFDKRGLLALLYYPSSYRFFLRVALGLGSSVFDSTSDDSDRKSIGVERTFREISDPDELIETCRKLCEKAVEHMRSENLKAKTVTLKMKTVEFDVKTRATTLDSYVCDFDPVFNAAKSSMMAEIAATPSKKLRLRLMGIRLSSFFHETDAARLKLPDITRYLRQPACNDALASSPTKSALSIDENSVDSTASGGGTCFAENDDVIVLSDDDEVAAASAVQGPSAIAFSTDVSETEIPDVGNSDFRSPVACPVCNCRFTRVTSDFFNKHLDQCLNRKAISHLVKEQDRELSASVPRVEKKSDKRPGKRKSESPAKSRVQKRLVDNGLSGSTKKIDDYFKPL